VRDAHTSMLCILVSSRACVMLIQVCYAYTSRGPIVQRRRRRGRGRREAGAVMQRAPENVHNRLDHARAHNPRDQKS